VNTFEYWSSENLVIVVDRHVPVPGPVELLSLPPWQGSAKCGTRHLRFEPLELLEKLAALTPRPRIKLVLYHGVLAPHARWRASVVAYGTRPAATSLAANPSGEGAIAKPTHRHWPWAKLMHRAFEIDVLACPWCGGRLCLIATVEDPREIREVLRALALSDEPVDRAPPLRSLDTSSTADVNG